MTAAALPALPPRARSLRAQVFAATWLSYAGFYCTRKVFSVTKGPIKAALHIDDLHVSHLFTTYLVAYMLGQFLAAWLSQRVTNRTQLLLGMTVSVGCNVAMGALLGSGGSHAYFAIAAVMAVHGIAQATGWPCNVGLMGVWTRRAERGRVMAAWTTSYQLGSVFAKALAAFLFGALGLLWSFWGAAAVLGLVTLFFMFAARESPESCGLAPFEPEETAPVTTSADAVPDAAQTAQADLRESEANRRRMSIVLAMGMIYFAFKFLRYALDSWSVLIITEHFTTSTTSAGYISTAFDWIGFLGVLFAGWLSDRLGSRVKVIVFMTLGMVVASGLLWSVGLSSVTAFGVILGLIGFMCMGPDSLLSGAGAVDTGSPRRAAIAAGIINGCGSVGPIVQEPMIGWLKTNYGVGSVMTLLFGVSVAAAIGVFAFRARVRRLGFRL